jgi:hypothetical protein
MNSGGCALGTLLVALMIAMAGLAGQTTSAPEITPTTPYIACAWNWHRESLPEVEALLAEAVASNEALRGAGAVITAVAFGETCGIPGVAGGQFAVMETDFTVTLAGTGYSDDQLGALVLDLVAVIDALPDEMIPGANPGYLALTFDGTRRQAWLRTLRTAIENGERGAALMSYFD